MSQLVSWQLTEAGVIWEGDPQLKKHLYPDCHWANLYILNQSLMWEDPAHGDGGTPGQVVLWVMVFITAIETLR